MITFFSQTIIQVFSKFLQILTSQEEIKVQKDEKVEIEELYIPYLR